MRFMVCFILFCKSNVLHHPFQFSSKLNDSFLLRGWTDHELIDWGLPSLKRALHGVNLNRFPTIIMLPGEHVHSVIGLSYNRIKHYCCFACFRNWRTAHANFPSPPPKVLVALGGALRVDPPPPLVLDL